MRPRSTGAVLAAATLTAAALTLAGCGGEPTAGAPPAEQSATPKAAASSAGPGTGLTERSFVPSITAAMVEAGSARIVATVEAPGQTLRIAGSSQVSERSADSAMEMTIAGGGIDGRMILVDQTLYLDLGPATGGKYVRFPLDRRGAGAGPFDQLLRSTDTAAAVDALQGAVEDLEVLGQERVDGVETTKYQLTVDTKRALASQRLPPEAARTLPDTLDYQMWVDEDRLLRRMVVRVPGAETTLNASRWGEPIDVQAPPTAQISRHDPFAATS